MLCIAIALPAVPLLKIVTKPIIGVEQAYAQQKKQRKSLFDILFKRRNKKKQIKVKRPPKKVTTRKTRSAKRTTSRKKTRTSKRKKKQRGQVARAKKPAVITVKNENAGKILVFGDFLAGGMARELEKLYQSNPDIVIVGNSNPSSGLVRDDVVNWPEKLPALLEELKPIAVVSLVGMNDRQKLWSISGRPDKLSETWLTEYNKRIEGITTAVASTSVPLVWVGLPPVRSSSMNADYLAFNDLYRTKIEISENASYVDIWDGFTNEQGKFVSAGPDINGQIVRLRGKKGINMTRAGRAKLAFFADKELRRRGIIKNAQNSAFAGLGTINLNSAQPAAIIYDPVGTGKTNTIALGSPALDGGDLLDGGKSADKKAEDNASVSYKLVEKGVNLQPKAGRIDSGWGTPSELEIVKPEEKKDEEKTSSLKTPALNTATSLAPTSTQPVSAN
jgi:hypothetical protein